MILVCTEKISPNANNTKNNDLLEWPRHLRIQLQYFYDKIHQSFLKPDVLKHDKKNDTGNTDANCKTTKLVQ